MKLKPYAEYKDSGVEWLGQVPEGWKTTPVKRFGSLKGGAGFPHEEQGVVSEEFDFHKVNALGSAFSDGLLQPSENTISRETAQRLGAFIFPKRAIVFAKVGAALLLGRIRELAASACIDNNMMGLVVDQESNDVSFVRYAMSLVRFDLISNPGAVPSLNESQIGNFPLIAPMKIEQLSIANFLDRETAKLDTLIAKQERLIELLQEKRQAIISHAVTKGLNPDAKMKDSGVEWLGMVPDHWYVSPLKRVIGFQEGPGILAVDFHEEGIPLLRISCIQGEFTTLDGCNFLDSLKVKSKWEHFRVKTGDLLISASASMGGVSEVTPEVEGAVPYTGIIRLFPLKFITNDFIKVFVVSDCFLRQIDHHKSGSTIQHFGPSHLNMMFLAVPPQDEQLKIVTYIKVQTNKIDTLIEKAKRSIELAKEHRTALISAAITGKIDVRELA